MSSAAGDQTYQLAAAEQYYFQSSQGGSFGGGSHHHISELRRATSYCGAHSTSMDDEPATASFGSVDHQNVVTDLLIGHTTSLASSKHRRLLQAQQAWLKYQVSETSTTADSFKDRRAKLTA